MATIFPTSPTNGQHVTSNGITWEWDGEKWQLFSDITLVFQHKHTYDGDVYTTGTGTAAITIDGGTA